MFQAFLLSNGIKHEFRDRVPYLLHELVATIALQNVEESTSPVSTEIEVSWMSATNNGLIKHSHGATAVVSNEAMSRSTRASGFRG